MTATRKLHPPRTGFTLVEVMLAVTVIALTVTAAFTLLSAGLKIHDRLQAGVTSSRDSRALWVSLHDDIANLYTAPRMVLVSPNALTLLRFDPPAKTETVLGNNLRMVFYRWEKTSNTDSVLTRTEHVVTFAGVDSAAFVAAFDSVASIHPITSIKTASTTHDLAFQSIQKARWSYDLGSTPPRHGLLTCSIMQSGLKSPNSRRRAQAADSLAGVIDLVIPVTRHMALDAELVIVETGSAQ